MTSPELLDQLLLELTEDQRDEFRLTYGRIQRLPASELALQPFLDEFLRQTVRLFAANAGAIWFRAPMNVGAGGSEEAVNASQIRIVSRIGMDRLGLDDELNAAHTNLVNHVFKRHSLLAVKPYSAPHAKAGVSNPTDSFILFGPAIVQSETLAVVELFLGPTPVRGKTAGDRRRYVLWLDHLVDYFCQGIERRFLARSAPLQPALEGLASVREQIGELKEQLRGKIEGMLLNFAGWNFGSLQRNQSFARQLHQLLDENGLRVVCSECGSPAILRCQSSAHAKTGVFVFDHYLDTGRTFHGGRTTLPRLSLVSKPPRRNASPEPQTDPPLD